MDGRHCTPFLLAIVKCNLHVVKLFMQPNIKERLNLNSTDMNGYTALHIAMIYNHIELAKWIIESGRMDLSITDFQGNTPIDLARVKNFVDLVDFMIQADRQHNLPQPK